MLAHPLPDQLPLPLVRGRKNHLPVEAVVGLQLQFQVFRHQHRFDGRDESDGFLGREHELQCIGRC
jgi:hypothetical protein